MRFLLGGYTADMDGAASGIGMLQAGAADEASAGGPLAFTGSVVTADSPSWIAPHPTLDVIYATLEQRGAVQAFRQTGEESFTALGDPVDAGEAVCHVAVAPDGGSLIAACWGDGRVVQMRVDASGRPHSPAIAPASADPYAENGITPRADGDLDLAAAARALREAAGEEYAHLVPEHDAEPPAEPAAEGGAEDEASVRPTRAHQVLFLPGGIVATSDLGHDLVRFWRRTMAGLEVAQEVVLPRGSGPRHMILHPSGHLYVVTELSCEVFVLAASADGTWRLVGGTPLGSGTLPDDTAAELTASRDGAFLYAGVRGSNTLATLRVRGEGDTIEPVALVESGVDWPRHHIVVRDTLLVAGQKSDDVASLSLDLRTGVPGRVRFRAAVPSPTCIMRLR